VPIHPSSENRTLSPVATLKEKNADLEFQNRDDREVEVERLPAIMILYWHLRFVKFCRTK